MSAHANVIRNICWLVSYGVRSGLGCSDQERAYPNVWLNSDLPICSGYCVYLVRVCAYCSVITPKVSQTGREFFCRLVPRRRWIPTRHRTSCVHFRVVPNMSFDVLPDFADVLRCYVFLLRRLGADLWSNESSDYPQVIFDAIKDNPSFADLTRNPGWKSNEPWLLVWFSDYLHSIWTYQIFDDVLVRMVDFLCEELQHERFQEARPACMIAAIDVCLSPCLVVDLRISWTTATSYRYLQIRDQGRFYTTHSRSSFARHSRGPLRLRGLLADIQHTRVG